MFGFFVYQIIIWSENGVSIVKNEDNTDDDIII